MANAFDSDNFQEYVPDVLTVGDRWIWKREDIVSDYPTSDYALSYSFRLKSGAATHITITASETSTSYVVEVASNTTASYTKGNYHYQEYITRSSDSQRILLQEGHVEIKGDYANDNADPRTHAEIVVDALEAMLESRATIDQSSMSIAGRSLSRMTPEEIRDWYEYYRSKVAKQIQKERVKNKQEPTGRLIKARF